MKECNDIANIKIKLFYQEENSLSEVWTRQLAIAYLGVNIVKWVLAEKKKKKRENRVD